MVDCLSSGSDSVLSLWYSEFGGKLRSWCGLASAVSLTNSPTYSSRSRKVVLTVVFWFYRSVLVCMYVSWNFGSAFPLFLSMFSRKLRVKDVLYWGKFDDSYLFYVLLISHSLSIKRFFRISLLFPLKIEFLSMCQCFHMIPDGTAFVIVRFTEVSRYAVNRLIRWFDGQLLDRLLSSCSLRRCWKEVCIRCLYDLNPSFSALVISYIFLSCKSVVTHAYQPSEPSTDVAFSFAFFPLVYSFQKEINERDAYLSLKSFFPFLFLLFERN